MIQLHGNSPLFYHANKNVEQEIQSVFLDIFSKCIAVHGEEEIVITGYVLADGKGDYFHIRALAKELHRAFPNRKIRLIVGSDERHKNRLPILDSKICITHLSFLGKSSPMYPGKPTMNASDFAGINVLEKIKQAAVIISGPIDISGLFDPIQDEIVNKTMSFFEYDLDKSNKNISLKEFRTGFGIGCKGIFTKMKKDLSLDSLENPCLKDILFNNLLPTSEDIKRYHLSHHLFLCYVSNLPAAIKFIQHALTYAQSEKEVDICYPCKGEIQLLENLLKEKQEQWLKNNVSSIYLIYYENGEKRECCLHFADKGKKLRIIDVGLLSQKDFKTLANTTEPLMACTGDNSLALVLRNQKIPFYEVVAKKGDFLKNIILCVQETIGENCELANYLQTLLIDPLEAALKIGGRKVAIQMVKEQVDSKDYEFFKKVLLHGKEIHEAQLELEELEKDRAIDIIKTSSEQLIQQAKQFGDYVRERKSLNPSLRATVNEMLCRYHFPSFAGIADQLIKSYKGEIISKNNLVNKITNLLSDLNLMRSQE